MTHSEPSARRPAGSAPGHHRAGAEEASGAAGISPEGAHVARVFDALGMEFERAFAERKQAQTDAVEDLSRRLAPGSRVLDVGCATGRPTAEQLCAMGLEVTGIDVSEVMLAHARRQVPRARFVLADLFGDVPAGLGVYDAVVCLFCFVDLPELPFVEGLRRLGALTVPGGTLLFAVPESQGGEEVRFLDRTYRPMRCLREDVHRYAQLAGLDVERVEARTEVPSRGQAAAERSLFLWARTPSPLPRTPSPDSGGVDGRSPMP
ncbi:class I SAM-dependent methyltransferase [Streptomyces iconiensis]|uniref:Class I SAM-dependent methyltransferase n=1 Tax=Streptomyces iconiensis TaxID=1384038 RepID=A0ABT6ZQB8_9ACTN|nr:class I SAM-dependent methyltransferase [Streptomyces iconiensis]MDJ1131254.1 class I SAM-dependent methyltransferase [Streptomyces iconiensis]